MPEFPRPTCFMLPPATPPVGQNLHNGCSLGGVPPVPTPSRHHVLLPLPEGLHRPLLVSSSQTRPCSRLKGGKCRLVSRVTDSPTYAHHQLEQQYSSQPLVVITRSLQVVAALAKLLLLQQQQQQFPRITSPGSSFERNGEAAPAGDSGVVQNDTSPAATQQQQAYSLAVQQLLSGLGPLWVKLGQTLAVRPDVVGPRLASALSGLQEAAPPFSTAAAMIILEQELGAPSSELFAAMSEEPVASASLGQVYKAILKDDGREVAVKVQRPGLWPQLELDLAILTQLLRLLRRVGRIKQDITAWADTLGQGLAQELDYVQEGHNLEEFAAAHNYLAFVTTPTVVWSLTTTRVLTTTWVEGRTPGQILHRASRSSAGTISNTTTTTTGTTSSTSTSNNMQAKRLEGNRQQAAEQLSPEARADLQRQLLQLVDLGIHASLHQLLVTGVLHADPHPGNLLLSGGRLVYLDFGLLVRVPAEVSMAMMAALLHWSQANWLGLATDMRHMGLLKPTTDLQELAADLQQRFQQLYRNNNSPSSSSSRECSAVEGSRTQEANCSTTSTSSSSSSSKRSRVSQAAGAAKPSALLQQAGAIGFGDFAGVIASLAIKYRFELPPYYTLVIRSLTTLEGFALLVDPAARYSIAQSAVKVVAGQLLRDQRPAAQQLLQEVLVFEDQQGAQRLNLPLLEELLQLLSTQPGAYGGSSTTAVQWRALQVLTSAQKPVDLVSVVQQLGLPAPKVAEQLSSQHAAGIRALLVQLLLSRLQRQPSFWQGTRPEGVAVRQSRERVHVHHVSQGAGGAQHNNIAFQHVLQCLKGMLWFMRAGFCGIKLLCQLAKLAVILAVGKVMAMMHRGLGRVDNAV